MPTNKSVITVITTAVAIMAFVCVSTICFLAYNGIDVPPELNTIAGGLVTGLMTMLVKTSPTETTKGPPDAPLSGKPEQVEVVKISDPIPTTESSKFAMQ